MKHRRNFHSAIAIGLAIALSLSLLAWAIAFKSAFIVMGLDIIR